MADTDLSAQEEAVQQVPRTLLHPHPPLPPHPQICEVAGEHQFRGNHPSAEANPGVLRTLGPPGNINISLVS